MLRKIIHIDMDAFFASVEQRDRPELRGKPIAVGGSEWRGVVCTASYEARIFGVKSAMPGWQAKKLCPELIFVEPRFDAYQKVSEQIREIFEKYTDQIESVSIDEAYLDVTENLLNESMAMSVAQKIQEDVLLNTGLSCSAGVSYCKFLAKVASDLKKPKGLTVIHPDKAIEFINNLPIEKFHGIGKVTASKMKLLGIHKGADLNKLSKLQWVKRFGKSGIWFYNLAKGIDDRPVLSFHQRKSIGVERTLEHNISELTELELVLEKIIQKLIERVQRIGYGGRTMSLKLKSADFIIQTFSKTYDHWISTPTDISIVAYELLYQVKTMPAEIRLLGLTLTNLNDPLPQDQNPQMRIPFPEIYEPRNSF